MIAEVARNLTAEGREVNLWEIMTKVNSTVRQNPNSSLARLMHRDGWMADNSVDGTSSKKIMSALNSYRKQVESGVHACPIEFFSGLFLVVVGILRI